MDHNFDARRSGYQQGDHVCSLFLAPEDQLRTAVEYIKGGFARRERCLYVCCEHPVDQFRDALRAGGIDVDREERRGALVIVTKQEGHLKTGCFDPDEMIELLATFVAEALRDGYQGLCAAGDMAWVLDHAPGTERLAEYEARLNHFCESTHVTALCLYNLKTLSPQMLEDCLATHRLVHLKRVDGPVLVENPFYDRSNSGTNRATDPHGLHAKVDWLKRIARSSNAKA